MNRRRFLLAMSLAAPALAQTPAAFTWDYYDPARILTQDVGNLTNLPVSAFAQGLSSLPVSSLPNINWYALQDVPGLLGLTVNDIPGLIPELLMAGYTLPTDEVGNYLNVSLVDIPDLNFDYFIRFPSLQALTLGAIPNITSLTFNAIPGLGNFPFYSQISAFGSATPLFGGAYPSIVEVIARRVQGGDAAIFAVDRGHPWYVGQYRYLTPQFRVQLDTISAERPGTAHFHAEILVCYLFGCVWVPLPWPDASEQNYALYIPEGPGGFIPSYPLTTYNPSRNAPANPGSAPLDPGDCSNCQGIAYQAYATAISRIEGSYGSVGPYLTNLNTFPLGRYQYLGSRSDVRAVIAQNPGGSAFLAKVNGGVRPSPQEVLRNFTPRQQDDLFRSDACTNIGIASRQIDPTTGRNFSGDRLIERAAQIHFGGPDSSRIDSGRSDVLGRLSIYGYGKTALANYKRSLSQLSCAVT
ncbi:hypothetical protein [Anthocerotibacter panamensis]|uniref:hypothetical protein n=1 Tax=Anthocerotibacter panamensis TaxID=2857077 RepID=UPI001C403A46|nr:hypothetical protein [Anthocerotibacter panamensis]